MRDASRPSTRRVPLRGLIVAAVVAGGCAQLPTYVATPVGPEQASALREQVRALAKPHCGQCHQSSRPTANPAAVRIYDLDAEQWSSTLTAARLQNGFPRRLHGRLSAADQQTLRAFIEAELALRQ